MPRDDATLVFADAGHCGVSDDDACLVLEGMELWRVGTKLGRTVYRQHGLAPCGHDQFLGIFDSADTAALVCKVMNEWFSGGNSSQDTPAPSAD